MIFNEMMPELTAEELAARARRLRENGRREYYRGLYTVDVESWPDFPTSTDTVHTQPLHILVASDFKRGIPCS